MDTPTRAIPRCPECGTARWIERKNGGFDEVNVIFEVSWGQATTSSFGQSRATEHVESEFVCGNGHSPHQNEELTDGLLEAFGWAEQHAKVNFEPTDADIVLGMTLLR